jgi:nitrite reductase/ring-hydroxylating ferredoxin subunit/uncharacterized membrane protein
MRSKVNIKGHPLHPALIPFPIAFLAGALGFDVAGRLLERPAFWTTGHYLAMAGVVAGLLAAVPGIVDYFTRVPPRSTGKTRATKHALANVGAITLFTIAWLMRGGPESPPDGLILALEAVGVGLMTMGGWMGGTLVNRNQIGVDHRYASAGKWREETVQATPGQPVVVARIDELSENQIKLLHVNGRRIALARTNGRYAAFDDRCTHRGGPLADGMTACGIVQCPWHGSQFDVQTGQVRAGPAGESITTYRVEESDGQVRLVM